MKNRRNIVEQKYPPRNNEDIWLKDLQLYTSTTKGWQPLGSEKTYSNKEELLTDKPTGGTIGIDKETGTAYLYNDVSKEWTPVGDAGEGITQVTWQELKDKRDAGKLIPGSLYRITDYNCTTTQDGTRSAGHQFDIVLLALSEDKLAEEGWAMMHEDIYDVTFADGVTLKCYLYNYADDEINIVLASDITKGCSFSSSSFEINENAKTATVDEVSEELIISGEDGFTYNYFQNSNLSAWKVWYCLDNDKSRFAWADDTIDTEGTGLPNGRGVIYRLIDEWNNDVGYDFKNIQFIRPLTNGAYDTVDGEDTWVYTFNLWYNDICNDSTIIGNTMSDDSGTVVGVKENYIEAVDANWFNLANTSSSCVALSVNTILSTLEGDWFYGIKFISIKSDSHDNVFRTDESNAEYSTLLGCRSCEIQSARHCWLQDCMTIETYDNNIVAIKCNSVEIMERGIYFGGKKVLTES